MYKPIAMPCNLLPAMRSFKHPVELPTAAPLPRRVRAPCGAWPIKGSAVLLILAAALLSSTQRLATHVFNQVIVFGDSNVDSGYYKLLSNPGGGATYNSLWTSAVAAGAGAPTTNPGPVNSQILAGFFDLSAWSLAVFFMTTMSANAGLLPERVEKVAQERTAAGTYQTLVFGVVDGDKSEVVAFGKLDNGKTPDGDTVYEIGSITKTFTATLLAQAVLSDARHAGGTIPARLQNPVALRVRPEQRLNDDFGLRT